MISCKITNSERERTRRTRRDKRVRGKNERVREWEVRKRRNSGI